MTKRGREGLSAKRKLRIIIIFVIVITIGIVATLIFTKKTDNDLQVISLEEFENILTSKETNGQYIYIGRESCPNCTTVYPTLCKISEKNNLSILYYSTEQDREKSPKKMQTLLEKIKVDSVPTVIKIDNCSITQRYDGEEFIKLFT